MWPPTDAHKEDIIAINNDEVYSYARGIFKDLRKIYGIKHEDYYVGFWDERYLGEYNSLLISSFVHDSRIPLQMETSRVIRIQCCPVRFCFSQATGNILWKQWHAWNTVISSTPLWWNIMNILRRNKARFSHSLSVCIIIMRHLLWLWEISSTLKAWLECTIWKDPRWGGR